LGEFLREEIPDDAIEKCWAMRKSGQAYWPDDHFLILVMPNCTPTGEVIRPRWLAILR
jgi:hypothetical protein